MKRSAYLVLLPFCVGEFTAALATHVHSAVGVWGTGMAGFTVAWVLTLTAVHFMHPSRV